MPYVLDDLVVDRVDFVDEGANTGSFIELFKRKEQNKSMDVSEILRKMKPGHAEVIQAELDGLTDKLSKANSDIAERDARIATLEGSLETVNSELDVFKSRKAECTCEGEANADGFCSVCGGIKKSTSFDETEVLKSMPDDIREEYLKMKNQRDAAEEQVRKAAEEKLEKEAFAKAAALKAIPVEQATLVQILKSCDQSVIDVLSAAATAIEATVLDEVGKSREGHTADPWAQIERLADEIVGRDSVTKQKAIATVIQENPELYREYLKEGGTN